MTEEKRNQTEQCSAINCENYQCDSKHLAFHRFPKDPHRCASWVENLGNASLMTISCKELRKSYKVCSAHFLPSQFKRPSDVHAGLKRDAVPTRANAPKRSSPLDTELQRKRPKQRQEMATKKRKQSHVVHPSNAGASTAAASVKQSTDSSETNGSVPTVIAVVAKRLVTAKISLVSTPSQTHVTVPDDAVASPTEEPQTSLLPPTVSQTVTVSDDAVARPTEEPQTSLLPPTVSQTVTVPDDAVASPTEEPQTSLLPPTVSQTVTVSNDAVARPTEEPQTSLLPPRVSQTVTVSNDAVASPTEEPQTSLLPPKPSQTHVIVSCNPFTRPTEEPQSFLLPPRPLSPKPKLTYRERRMIERIQKLKSKVSRLKAEVKELKKNSKVTTRESMMEQLKAILPAPTYAFVSTQIREARQKPSQFRWTAQDKAFFGTLLQTSPRSYQLLSQVVSVPAKGNLQKYLNSPDFKANSVIYAKPRHLRIFKPIDEVTDVTTESVDDPAEGSFASLEELEEMECPFEVEELEGPFPPEKLLMTPLRASH